MDIIVPGGIFYGRGNFQFDLVPVSTTYNFLVGDFDGDGIPDIATSDGVLFGLGNRQFTAPMNSSPLPSQYQAAPAVAADLSRDGKDDIVVGDDSTSVVEIYLSMGRDGFEQGTGKYQITSYAIGVNAVQAFTADFTGAGNPDIAFQNYGFEYQPPAVTVLLHK